MRPINIQAGSEKFIDGNLLHQPENMFSSDTYKPGCMYNKYNEKPMEQNFEFLITQVYHGFLDRDVESKGVTKKWERVYNNKGLTSFIKKIGLSAESKRLNLTGNDKVLAAYLAILRRDPESDKAYRHWNKIISRYGYEQMLERISSSIESQKLNSAY